MLSLFCKNTELVSILQIFLLLSCQRARFYCFFYAFEGPKRRKGQNCTLNYDLLRVPFLLSTFCFLSLFAFLGFGLFCFFCPFGAFLVFCLSCLLSFLSFLPFSLSCLFRPFLHLLGKILFALLGFTLPFISFLYYSIGRIIDSIKAISSSVKPYLA